MSSGGPNGWICLARHSCISNCWLLALAAALCRWHMMLASAYSLLGSPVALTPSAAPSQNRFVGAVASSCGRGGAAGLGLGHPAPARGAGRTHI
eukprot:scaffold5365_cov115-Isochrysis_galbana.AAC.5